MNRDDLGRLLLRVTVGGLLLFHGIFKFGHGIEHIVEMVRSHGLPGFVAYGVYLGEAVAPVFVVLGIYTRPAALVMAVNMVVAILLAHTAIIGHLGSSGGWAVELQVLYLAGSLAVALLGGGRLSVSGGGRWS